MKNVNKIMEAVTQWTSFKQNKKSLLVSFYTKAHLKSTSSWVLLKMMDELFTVYIQKFQPTATLPMKIYLSDQNWLLLSKTLGSYWNNTNMLHATE